MPETVNGFIAYARADAAKQNTDLRNALSIDEMSSLAYFVQSASYSIIF